MEEHNRFEWILKYMISHPLEQHFSVLNTDFIETYVEKTFAKSKGLSCPRLGSDLSAMYKKGWLDRRSIGLTYREVGAGKPKWIWSYSIAPLMLNQARYFAELDAAVMSPEAKDRIPSGAVHAPDTHAVFNQ